MNDKPISSEDLEAISHACDKCMWKPLLDIIISGNNEPQDLTKLDAILKKDVTCKQDLLYPSNKAIRSLNNYLNKAELPFRIKRVTKGLNCYTGTVKIAPH